MPNATGGPAFPESYINIQGNMYTQPGMTLRDYFAGQAIIGALCNIAADCIWNYDDVPAMAYRLADAMLAERAKETE